MSDNTAPKASVPPERICLKRVERDGHMAWAECSGGDGEPEYILLSTHNSQVERLREALRGLVQRTLSSGPCWCVYPPEIPLEYFENVRAKDGHDNGFRHESACTAAREALSAKGKE